MQKHLVTGGSGFLGHLVAKRLVERGKSVRVLDVWKDPELPKEVEFVQCDVCDRESVRSAMNGIDIVHHLAALVPLTKSGQDFKKVNVEGSCIVAEEASRANVEAFIHMSSSAVYGSPECPITADSPTAPLEEYGLSKLQGEVAVMEVCKKEEVPLIVIRPRTILGRGRLGIFQMLFEWIEENRKIYVVGSGDNHFQFVHASDLMDAYMLLLDRGASGIYNVGALNFGTLKQALENLMVATGSKSKVVGLPIGLSVNLLRMLDVLGLSPLAPWHYLTYHKDFYFDVEPLVDMGWRPHYSNDQMLEESYRWFQKNKLYLNKSAHGHSAHRQPVKEKILNLLKALS